MVEIECHGKVQSLLDQIARVHGQVEKLKKDLQQNKIELQFQNAQHQQTVCQLIRQLSRATSQ